MSEMARFNCSDKHLIVYINTFLPIRYYNHLAMQVQYMQLSLTQAIN